MAISKRRNPLHTSICKKDGKKKIKLVENIRETLENFIKKNDNSTFVYLISLNNQRNSPLKTLRSLLLPGRVFYGKNKVMRIAFGTKPEDEIHDNIHKISKNINGETAVLITSEDPEVVIKKVKEYKVRDFSKAGNIATDTIVLKVDGKEFDEIPGSMEPQFRQLGMPTALNMGKIILMGDFTLCEKDKPLTPNQTHLLKLFGIRMSLFEANVLGFWNDGHYKQLA
ncbi:60S ribosomal protein L10e, putative [Theileria annulata]|uniref:Ribosome assembly factor mrt4 n=1 Tax=Theileria annulata TaxID=5874 RepID=Q4UIL5_THEAN|nr:60S ribosomal protein L10e, putative [Theileria annulata]CAI73074.1 60S ribosomal protein L10e, putative [Theileria annulata]|eukprot:XP_953752.1 60S ribosomal protein L10e, putative [Theileria annulata]